MACGNCGQENCTNCSEVLCTSDITCVNAQFINLNIPSDADLNDVLEALEQYITNSVTAVQNISIHLSSGATCIGLTAGTYSYAQVFNAIITTICDLVGAVAPTTDDVPLGEGISVPSCLLPFTGTTDTELLNAIMTKLCSLFSHVIIQTDPYDSSDEASFLSVFIMNDLFSGLLDNHSFVYNQINPVTSTSNLNFDVRPLKAVVNDYPVKTVSNTTISCTPNKDVYVVLSQTGSVTKIEQTIGDPTPTPASTEILLYKAVTSGTGVSTLFNLFETEGLNPTPLVIPNDFIETVMIKDGNITNQKLDNVVTAGTFGHPSIISVTVNTKGRITGYTANLNLTALANGDILVYNSGTNAFENAVPPGIGSNGFIPLADSGSFTASSLEEGTSQVKSNKKVEINTLGGLPIDDPSAGLNIVGSPLMLSPMSAISATALPITEGYVVCVNTTDATFTSVGFWGVIAGVWTKFT